MKHTSLYSLLTAAALAMAMTDASALVSAPVYPVGGIAEASVPAAFASLIWMPVLAVMAGLGLALFWLLRTPKARQEVEAGVRRVPERKPRSTRRMRSRMLPQRRPLRSFPRRAALPV